MAVKPASTSRDCSCEKMQFDDTFALHLWPCSPVLAQFILSNKCAVSRKVVLELGSGGTALPGIVALKSSADHVIFTDQSNHQKAQELCRENCVLNGIDNPDIRELDWGILDSKLFSLPKINCVLASDCFFDPCVFEKLLVTISWLLSENVDAKCYFSYQERDSNWTIDYLLDKWKLKCDLIEPEKYHGGCMDIPGFNNELKRHTVHIGVMYK